jgi:tetratricopeptide (TPR) repeat protein
MNYNTPPATAPSIGRWALFTLHGRAKIFLFLGLQSSAKRVFQAVLERAPQDLLALNSLGFSAMHEGNFILALTYFDQVADLSVESSNAHFNQAFVCEELGRLDNAERGFRAAIAIEEKMDRAWYGLGLVLVRQGRLEDAVVALKRNTQLQPMSPFGWYQLARVHMDLKQANDALLVIRHLQGFEPKVAAQLERETGLKIGHVSGGFKN